MRIRNQFWGIVPRIAAALCGLATTVVCAQTDTSPIKFNGNLALEAAHIADTPARWSTLRAGAELNAGIKFSDDIRARISGRVSSDIAATVGDDIYPAAVRRDQRLDGVLREAYIEFPISQLGVRVGKQFFNWGEAVGVFVADVVNARDLREFVLPELEQQRIGQWAARLDWQGDNKSAEVMWIPVPTFDQIGFPGGDFYPQLPSLSGQNVVINGLRKPTRSTAHSNYGARAGVVHNGWDLSGFYYSSLNREVSFARALASEHISFTPQVGERIAQVGLTASKDLEFAVLKWESVFTRGRAFPVANFSDIDGLAPRNSVEWLIGLDVPVPESDARINAQILQRVISGQADTLALKKRQTYGSLQVVYPAGAWEASVLAIASLNQNEWLLRPKLTYKWAKNTRISLGADFFNGPALSLLGQYEARDRVFLRVKQSF